MVYEDIIDILDAYHEAPYQPAHMQFEREQEQEQEQER
jgi:hypothetical protein